VSSSHSLFARKRQSRRSRLFPEFAKQKEISDRFLTPIGQFGRIGVEFWAGEPGQLFCDSLRCDPNERSLKFKFCFKTIADFDAADISVSRRHNVIRKAKLSKTSPSELEAAG
jgi:hypothetical protein